MCLYYAAVGSSDIDFNAVCANIGGALKKQSTCFT